MNKKIGTWRTGGRIVVQDRGLQQGRQDLGDIVRYPPDGKLLVSGSHKHSQSDDCRQSEGEVKIWD